MRDGLLKPRRGRGTIPVMNPPSRGRPARTGGLILIAVGTIFLIGNLLPGYGFSRLWPLILIAIGAGMIWDSRGK